QGFGATGSRGSEYEYLELIGGDFPKDIKNVFDGINTTWTRIPQGKAIGQILEKVEKNFNFQNPAVHLKDLTKAYSLIQDIQDSYWREQKSEQIKNIILACSGMFLEAVSSTETTTTSQPFDLQFEVINRSETNIILKEIRFLDMVKIYDRKLYNNKGRSE